MTLLFSVDDFQLGQVPKRLSKCNLSRLLVHDFLQAGCPSCHWTKLFRERKIILEKTSKMYGSAKDLRKIYLKHCWHKMRVCVCVCVCSCEVRVTSATAKVFRVSTGRKWWKPSQMILRASLTTEAGLSSTQRVTSVLLFFVYVFNGHFCCIVSNKAIKPYGI